MIAYPWQCQEMCSAIVFDCDSTLTALEGIDELAVQNGVGEAVKEITAKAMNETGVTPKIFDDRLSLVKPSYQQVLALGQQYYQARVGHIQEIIKIFQKIGKTIFVVSAGLNPAVSIFAEFLGIEKPHIYAVNLMFDSKGDYVDFDRENVLVHRNGKKVVIAKILEKHQKISYVGDGMNDWEASNLAARFVGYGGVQYRENIANRCEFYIKSASLSPLLALCLTEKESKKLNPEDQMLYQQGIDRIKNKEVKTPC